MKIYFGCPTGNRRDNMINEFGTTFGACCTPYANNSITAKKMHWFFDNGAFKAHDENRPFDHELFLKKMWEIEAHIRYGKNWNDNTDFVVMFKENRKEPSRYQLTIPDFVVIPDKVACGDESLYFSREWYSYLKDVFPEHKYYLAVQDNMDIDEVEIDIISGMYEGIFVGGTKEWKYREGHKWVELAHKYNLLCHCGGVGSRKPLLWAKMCGFDSVDSGLAMIHPRHLKEVLNMDKNELLLIA